MAEPKTYELVIEDMDLSNENNLIEEIPTVTSLRKTDETIQNDVDIWRKESQPRTKLPVSRFRDTVDKVKKDAETNNNNSIPKPRVRTGIPVPIPRDLSNGGQNNTKINTDEDFDQLFREMNDNRDSIYIVDLNVCEAATPADPEVIENYFDNIIHLYDDKDSSGLRSNEFIPNEEIQAATLDFSTTISSQERPKSISFTLEENNLQHLTTESIVALDSTVTSIEDTLKNIEITDSNSISQNDSFIDITDNEEGAKKYETTSMENNNIHYITTESIVPLDSTITTIDDNVQEILLTDNNHIVNDKKTIEQIEPIMPLYISKVLRSLSNNNSNNENDVQIAEKLEKNEETAPVAVLEDAIKPKTVSEKLDIFKRKNESNKISRIPKFNKSLTTSLDNINKKPIIVDEIPKQQIMKYADTEETVTVLNDSSIEYNKIPNQFKLTEEELEKPKPVIIIHEIKEISVEDVEYNEVNNKNNDSKNKIRKYKSMSNMENEIEKERKKSLAEIYLGDSIKGRVGNVIQKMIAMAAKNNTTSNVKKYEIPKQTVAERIAQFENKSKETKMISDLVMDDGEPKMSIKNGHQTENDLKIDEAKLEDLRTAKETYGSKSVPCIELNNGVNMPVLALGTALMDPALTPHIIGAAIDLGYRAIDTAFIYGNEKVIGEAIRNKIDDGTVRRAHANHLSQKINYNEIARSSSLHGLPNGSRNRNEGPRVPNGRLSLPRLVVGICEAIPNEWPVLLREDLFIISKLWSTFHKPELVEEACKNSIKNLGLDYIDLYMIHNPMSFKEGGDVVPKIAKVLQYSTFDYMDAWCAMEQLVNKGLVKSIGVSNFNSEQLAKILAKGKVKPVVNQVESHPYLNQHRLDGFCSARGITLSCYATLGSKDTPNDLKSHQEVLLEDPLIKILAQAIDKTPAQMLIRYQLDHDRAVVVKSTSASHLWQNLHALDFKLNNQEIEALDALNKNKRYFTYKGMGDTHKNYPFKLPF